MPSGLTSDSRGARPACREPEDGEAGVRWNQTSGPLCTEAGAPHTQAGPLNGLKAGAEKQSGQDRVLS